MAGLKPRVIALSKHEGQSYGFYLRVEEGVEGHLVRALEMGGPAELAGLKDGDRIIRVNGTFVDNLEHSQVADLVKKSRLTVTFHILGNEAYQEAKRNGINLAEPQSYSAQSQPTMNGVHAAGPKLKLCFLQKSQKSKSSFGFSLKSSKDEEGMIMTDVIEGGIADNAGVRAGDRLVEINGKNVEGATHDQTVEKVKASGNSLMVLLVDKETDKYYKNKLIRLGTGLATTKHLPLKPRIAEITKGDNGYGFFLKEDPQTRGHFIGEIDCGSPAEKGGMKEMDRLVAVDGEAVNHYTHEQLVDKIHQLGNRCCLLVVDDETHKMYKMGGVSPLLYWEEMRSSLPQPSNPEPEVTPVPAMPDAAEELYKPKLCRMEKSAAGYGFHLNGIQGEYGQYIQKVMKGGVADRAGLEDDDVVVEVNGVNVEQSTHEEAVNLIRNSGNTLVLLVAGRIAYDHLKAKGVAITSKLLDPEKTPVQPRERTPSVSSTSSSEHDDVRL